MLESECREGVVVRHHSRRVYAIRHVANRGSKDLQKFPITIVYQGANGAVWAREISNFAPKFSVLYAGDTLAPEPEL